MQLINCTPHALNLFTAEQVIFVPSIRKYVIKEGQTPSAVIPPSGNLLNIKFDDIITVNSTVYDNVTVDTRDKRIVSCDPIPDSSDHCVVSALYAAGVKKLGGDVSRLRTVSDPVYESENNPKPVGCLGIAPAL